MNILLVQLTEIKRELNKDYFLGLNSKLGYLVLLLSISHVTSEIIPFEFWSMAIS